MVTKAESLKMFSATMMKLMELCSEDTILRAQTMWKSRVKELIVPFYTRIKDLQTEEEILAVIEEMESELGQTE